MPKLTPDQALVERALKRLKAVAYQHRRGGMDQDLVLAEEALEAFDAWTDPQPELFTEDDHHES